MSVRASPSSETARFDGKVVVVTGAGRNLGREYALLFAARGARVLVNDLGVGISDTDGVADAPVDPPADAVVAEIVAAGGEAVANRDTIATPEGGRAIVDAALDAFGTVDVVVNNAGQVRMAPFTELTEAQLDAVIDTQLRGALNVSRPAWAVDGRARRRPVRERVVGRRVRWRARRRGVRHGEDGRDRPHPGHGVGGPGRRHRRQRDRARTPRPGPRPGSGPFPASAELNEWLHPRLVAPLVGWLAHEACPVTGECFSVGGGHYARVGLEVTDGLVDRDATIETHRRRRVGDPRLAGDADQRRRGPTAMRRMFEGFRPAWSWTFSSSALSCMIRRCDSTSSSLISTA